MIKPDNIIFHLMNKVNSCRSAEVQSGASKGIVRWGESDEIWLKKGDNPEVRSAEQELKER